MNFYTDPNNPFRDIDMPLNRYYSIGAIQLKPKGNPRLRRHKSGIKLAKGLGFKKATRYKLLGLGGIVGLGMLLMG